MGGKYLTEKDRYQIEAYLAAGLSNKEIAEKLGKSARTIRREIQRGSVILQDTLLCEYTKYCADHAQLKYEENKLKKGRMPKIQQDKELYQYISEKIINEKYSPEAVIEEIKRNNEKFNVTVCMKTIYNYIDKGILKDLTNADLTVKKNKKPKKERKKLKRIKKDNKTSIEERPDDVNKREVLYHWEMDCIESAKKDKSALLVLTERVTRKNLLFKLKAKTVEEVKRVLDDLEKKLKHKFKKYFQSITVDNGAEFNNTIAIEDSILKNEKRTTVYYCHPYSSWERGSNENANRMIRRYIPKYSDIGKCSNEYIKKVENWLNNYPRGIFNFMSSNEVYDLLANP